MTGGAQMCTFRVSEFLLGLEVRHIREIATHRELTRVPLAPERVAGLLNLRGEVITVVDLRRRLGLEEQRSGVAPVHVIISHPDGPVSMMVDGVDDIVEVSDDNFEPPPTTISADAREGLRGVYKLDAELLLALRLDWVTSLGIDPRAEIV